MWSRVALANEKVPGGVFFNVTYATDFSGPNFFVNGNFSSNEIGNALKANGLTLLDLSSNNT